MKPILCSRSHVHASTKYLFLNKQVKSENKGMCCGLSIAQNNQPIESTYPPCCKYKEKGGIHE